MAVVCRPWNLWQHQEGLMEEPHCGKHQEGLMEEPHCGSEVFRRAQGPSG